MMTDDPIRLFVGTAANDEDLEAQMVYEYTLRKHTKRKIDLHWLKLSRDPNSFWYSDPEKGLGWHTSRWRTPFTALRWGIPAFCNFEGKAIYTDCDMIVMDDIGKLWDQTFELGRVVMTKGARALFCTTVFDCAHIRPYLPAIDEMKGEAKEYLDIKAFFKAHPHLIQAFKGNWNCHDGEHYVTMKDPDIKILHYTRIPTQPTHKWAKRRLENEGRKHWYGKKSKPHPKPEVTVLFDRCMKEAMAAGMKLKSYRDRVPFGDYGR